MALTNLIMYENDQNVLVHKSETEDFTSLSQLVVHESQEAIFFMNGQALDLFGAGRYTLETENIPKIGKLLGKPIDAKTPFHCEVYFVNKATVTGIKWGTDTKVRLFDPASGIHIEIGASGEFNIRVKDSRKLLVKLVGSERSLDKEQILGSNGAGIFRTMVVTQVKSYLADVIKEKNISILEIDGRLMEISESLKERINVFFDEYGLYVPEFFVARIVTPDDDPNFARLKSQYAEEYLKVRQEEIRKHEAQAAAERMAVEAETQARLKIIGAQGEAEALRLKKQAEADAYRMQAEAEAMEMKMKGYSYQQETSRMVGMEALKNGLPSGGNGGGLAGNVGGTVGEIAGLGVTLGALGGVVGMTKDALGGVFETAGQVSGSAKAAVENLVSSNAASGTVVCPSCGKTVNSGRFCIECGAQLPSFCPNCGKPVIAGAAFCIECGAKLK